jgi:hypothetical protein
MNMEIHRAGLFNTKLLHSLSTVQAAQAHLRLLTTSNSIPSVLVSQIGLCDVLLEEIRAIRSTLERSLRLQESDRPCAVAIKRSRGIGLTAGQSIRPVQEIALDGEHSQPGLRVSRRGQEIHESNTMSR